MALPSLQWQGSIHLAEFEDKVSGLVEETIKAARRVLRDAGVTATEINQVVLVGGSTRVPLVRKEVEAFFGRAPLTEIDPDRVVALGAALQADV